MKKEREKRRDALGWNDRLCPPWLCSRRGGSRCPHRARVYSQRMREIWWWGEKPKNGRKHKKEREHTKKIKGGGGGVGWVGRKKGSVEDKSKGKWGRKREGVVNGRSSRKEASAQNNTRIHTWFLVFYINLLKIFRYKKWLPTFENVHEFVPLWRCLVGYPPKDVASLWPFCTKRRSILIIIFVFGRLVGRFNSSIFQCRWIEQIRRKKRKKKSLLSTQRSRLGLQERAWCVLHDVFSSVLKQGHHVFTDTHK